METTGIFHKITGCCYGGQEAELCTESEEKNRDMSQKFVLALPQVGTYDQTAD